MKSIFPLLPILRHRTLSGDTNLTGSWLVMVFGAAEQALGGPEQLAPRYVHQRGGIQARP